MTKRMPDNLIALLAPFILTAALLIADQVSKAIVVATVPRLEYGGPIIHVIGNFFRIIHVRNLGVAFSIGRRLDPMVSRFLFVGIRLVVVVVLLLFYFKASDLTRLQRWSIAGILAGGLGNLIDGIFRPEGVVDFLDVRFYGLLGMERWPTFNIADSSVVVCGILLMLSVLFQTEHGGTSDEQES